jgi:phospholipid transport system substrate-binding protein
MRTRARWSAVVGFSFLAGLLMAAVPAVPALAAAGEVTGTSGAQVNASDPYQLVKSAANTLLDDLNAHRDEYRSDPAKLRMLVDQVLLPYFDSEFAARLVLGRSWLSATPQQR